MPPRPTARTSTRHLTLTAGNAVTSAEIERMRQKNKELVKKLRELDAQHEKQDEANQLRERCSARAP